MLFRRIMKVTAVYNNPRQRGKASATVKNENANHGSMISKESSATTITQYAKAIKKEMIPST